MDPDTLTAYYLLVNFGRFPGEYDRLPPREKALTRQIVLRSLREREKQRKETEAHNGDR